MTPAAVPLALLIRQLLLGRCEELDARGVAAFVSGWCTALDVVRRMDLTMPHASPELVTLVERLVDHIDEARRGALAGAAVDP